MHFMRFGRISISFSAAVALGLAAVAFAQSSEPAQTGKAPVASSQPASTQPAVFSHEALLKIVESKPLVVIEPTDLKGKPVKPEQKEELKRSDELLKEAEQLRIKGDFSAAAEKSSAAFNIRSSILGLENVQTITTKILGQSLIKWKQLPSATQERLAQAVKQLDSTQQLEDQGKYDEAADAAKKASATFKELLGAEDAEVAGAQLRLGAVLTNTSKLEDAEKALKLAGEIYKKVYGEEHPKVAAVFDRLGWMKIIQATSSSTPDPDRAQAAVDDLLKASQILNKTLGETAETAESLDNLGTALVYIGNMRAAAECKLRALVIRERVLGPEAKDTAVSLSNLAWLYIQLQQLDQAVPLRQRALAIFEKSLPPTHPYINVERQHLANAYAMVGRINDSIALYEKMTEDDRKQERTLDPEALGRLTRLGSTYLEAGRREQGDTTLARVHSLAKDLHTAGKQEQAVNVLQGLAAVYQQRRRSAEAAGALETCAAWDEKLRSTGDSLDLVQRASRLGAVYIDLGRLDDAKKILTDVIERIKKMGGENDLKIAGPMLNLASVCEKKGELDEAERLCDGVVQISETKLGRQALGTAYALISLGHVNALQKRYDLARFSLEGARDSLKLYEQQDPYGNLRVIRELGICYSLEGKHDKAMPLLRDSLSRARDNSKRNPGIHADAILAETLKRLMDASASNTGMQQERNEWRSELKTLLERLKAEDALDADQKAWLSELG